MNAPRVLVVGVGSAGRRHVENLLDAGADVYVHDVAERTPTGAQWHAAGLDDVTGFDGVVIATPTSHHAAHTLAALRGDAKVLVEKPLATSLEEALPVLEAGAERIMVGYNQRFHEPLQRVIRYVREGRVGRVLSVDVWYGLYLPEWRPGRDYRTVYSARSELGGGILLDASHEIDLLVWLLGPDLHVAGAIVDRVGDLDIDVEDTVRALLRAEDGAIAHVALDCLSRRYRRGVEVIGSAGSVRLDRSRMVIELGDPSGTSVEPADDPGELSYARQAERFVSWLRLGTPPPVDGHTASASLAIADAIRSAARR